jgi:ribosomal protein L29
MKKEQKKELRTKTTDELLKELRDMRSEVAKLTIDMKIGKVENTNALYRKKKDIARVMTYLSEKKEEAIQA